MEKEKTFEEILADAKKSAIENHERMINNPNNNVMTTKKETSKDLTPSELGKQVAKVLVNKGNKKTSFKTFCKAMKPDEFIKLTEEINKLMAETIEEEQKKLDKLKLLFPKFEK